MVAKKDKRVLEYMERNKKIFHRLSTFARFNRFIVEEYFTEGQL